MDKNKDKNQMVGDETSFEELLEQSLEGLEQLEPGQVVDATILKIGSEWTFLDVRQKGEGLLDSRELQNADGAIACEVGEPLRVFFLGGAGGELRFTTKIGGEGAGSAQLEQAWKGKIPVEGRIEKEVKGGYEVRLSGSARAFCPFSQLGLSRRDDSEDMAGKMLTFKITRYGEDGRNIVVSHRQYLDEERVRQCEELKQQLKVGDVVTGAIESIRDFGAFVNIGGVTGLLPVSEAAWGRVEDLEAIFKVGQELQLAVKSLDWENDRISFSLRELQADPWLGVEKRYPVGSSHSGRVSRLEKFGAFVALEEGLEGLLHISQLGEGKRLKHAKDVLSVNDVIQVGVESIDADRRRVSLVVGNSEKTEAPAGYSDQGGASLGTLGELLKARGVGEQK